MPQIVHYVRMKCHRLAFLGGGSDRCDESPLCLENPLARRLRFFAVRE